ncbi:MAG TPA: hypothetical protein VGH97_01770 [Thermoanaerobaculia bacterium]
MSSRRALSRPGLLLLLAILCAAPALAVRRTEDPLGLVPADAVTVGVVRWNALRSSPLAAKVFADFDHLSGDGDGARFLAETGLSPREDIDTFVIAMSAGPSGARESGLVLFEGRFDLARIGKALSARGATLQTSAGGGAYYRLAEKGGEPGAVSLVNKNLIVCGHEAAVIAALARRENGGEGGLTSGQGLGRHLSRVDEDASAWALLDLTRVPAASREGAGSGNGEPSQALLGAMKSVTLVAVQATVHGDSVDFAATGLSADAENRDLIADSLRGVLAMWRLAVSEKSPEMVPVIRRFQIDTDSDGVSIHGTLPGDFLRALSETRHAAAR